MAFKKWVVGHPDRELAKMMAEECDIDPFAALIACGRGIGDSSELEQMLCEEPLLCDARELPDIQKAADYINNAIAEDTLIAVFGDYDCDGVVATAVLADYLKTRGARAVTYIPDRESEGYGMNCGAIDKLHAMGVGLIITVDNGIACADEIAYAKELGIVTVVTDHHLPPETLPDAVAVVDPHIKGSAVGFREICGAEVAFKLICVAEDREPEELLPLYADMLCIAVVADVMPLVNENRSIVKEGLLKLKNSPRTGLQALMNAAALDRAGINAGRVAFGLAPRINAAGRMGDASRALKLLLCEDVKTALDIANELDTENTRRRENEKAIYEQAQSQIDGGLKHDRVIVVSGENWHMGTVGIVASRICERYGRPAVVISVKDGEAHGSGRSIKGFHLYDALCACSDCLTRFGGHELAAGVSLAPDKIDDFRRAINAYAQTREIPAPEIRLDLRLNPAGMSVDMALAIKELEPFGFGNPTPMFGIFGVKLEKINAIGGGKHLKLLFSKGPNLFQALLFGVTPEQFCFRCGDLLDLAVVLEIDTYRDEQTLSIQIKDIRMSDTDDTKLFEQIAAYDDYKSGACCRAAELFPTREEVGAVYKNILKGSVADERIKHLFLGELGLAKTLIAVDVLCELGLVKQEGGFLSAERGVSKTDLMCSEIYKNLYERVENDEAG